MPNIQTSLLDASSQLKDKPAYPIELDVIASGSSGNASLVQCAGHAVMIDCGITRKAFLAGCTQAHIDPASIHSILLTHEHSDHTKGLGVVLRAMNKMGTRPNLFALDGVLSRVPHIDKVEGLYYPQVIPEGKNFSLENFTIRTFPTSHDAFSPVGFRFMSDDDALGFMTDSGRVLDEAEKSLQDCRILAIEANYDHAMLVNGPYPRSLKMRIDSDKGHLSNDQCAREVQKLASAHLQQVIAMHISEHNNTYGEPVRCINKALSDMPFHVHVQSSSQRHCVIVK